MQGYWHLGGVGDTQMLGYAASRPNSLSVVFLIPTVRSLVFNDNDINGGVMIAVIFLNVIIGFLHD